MPGHFLSPPLVSMFPPYVYVHTYHSSVLVSTLAIAERWRQRRRAALIIASCLSVIGSRVDGYCPHAGRIPVTVTVVIVSTIAWRPHVDWPETTTTLEWATDSSWLYTLKDTQISDGQRWMVRMIPRDREREMAMNDCKASTERGRCYRNGLSRIKLSSVKSLFELLLWEPDANYLSWLLVGGTGFKPAHKLATTIYYARCNSPIGLNILFCADRFQTNIDGILNGSSNSYYNRSIADVQLRASSFLYELISIRDSRQSYFGNVTVTKAELTVIINHICSS